MGETTKETGRQGSTGFRITVKILGTIHRWLYRGSGGKWGQKFFWLSYITAEHDRAQDGTASDLATHLSARG